MTIRHTLSFLLTLTLLCAPAAAQLDLSAAFKAPTKKQTTAIAATVTDADTGSPIYNFDITIGYRDPSKLDTTWYPLKSFAPFNVRITENTFKIRTTEPLAHYAFYITAPGYLPQYSHEWELDTLNSTWSIKLKPAANITGTILSPSGNPVYNAQLIPVIDDTRVTISGPIFEQFNPSADIEASHTNKKPLLIYNSNLDGSFTLPPHNEKFRLLILSPQGYQLLEQKDLDTDQPNSITLGEWQPLTGSIKLKDKPIAGQLIKINGPLYAPGAIEDTFKPTNILLSFKTRTKTDGSFLFDYMPFQFINANIIQDDPYRPDTVIQNNLIKVQSDKFPVLKFDFDNTIITGKIINYDHTPLPKFYSATIELSSKQPLKNYSSTLFPDGSFTFQSIIPAELSLSANISFVNKLENVLDNSDNKTLRKTINIPTENPPLVLNLGTIPLSAPNASLDTGNAAPQITAKYLNDNQSFNLNDYRGKYVLLDFSPAFNGFAFSQIADVNTAYQQFKSNPNVKFFSFLFKDSPDFDPYDPKTYENKTDWPVVLLPNAADDAATQTLGASDFACIYLISPTGQIIAKDTDLFGPNIATTLQKLIPTQ
ncbi:AhpC/TSA family protein [Poriferisphaera corsica]|uniref:AhpC/TSA family protein n=1 Tax=Poriferisphaera corsica TaxID=2528020 RepID=A0A517YP67_9BACT|nr:redoxin domain-containing protein [Poriferisphaera corsica]QDU32017.1 AhpC/TSA family protein [Poriferisphaera corsica]